MSSAFTKDTLRSISRSLGRFVAIAAIAALGTGFYAGLRMTAPDMDLAADRFFDGTGLMDIRVVSTLGVTDDDVEALRQVDGIEAVMPAYETDIVATIGGEQYATRVHSLPDSALQSDTSDGVHARSDDADYLNRAILAEGSWPQKAGECVISDDLVASDGVAVGDTIAVTEVSTEGVLVSSEYTVVGRVSASYYATSSSMGTTSLGSGTIQQYIYVRESEFTEDTPYTEAFLKVAGADDELASSEAYDDVVGQALERVEAIAPVRAQARTDQLVGEAQDELDAQRADYEAQKADAEAQLADAAAQIADAEATIASNEAELQSGQASYDEGVSELATQRQQAYAQLDASEQELSDAQTQADAAASQLESAAAQLESAWSEWQTSSDQLSEAWAAWQQQYDALSQADPAYAQAAAALEQTRAELATQQTALDQAKAQLDEQQASYDTQKASYDASVAQIAQGQTDLQTARAQAEAQLASAQQELDSAAAQLASGRAELADGKAQLEEARAEYETQKAEADAEFADAEAKLADAQEQVDAIESATWYVTDRSTNAGAASFQADADRIDSIAQVFPFIFFLVAALVSLTTMTRMVEEERVVIGTYKALGYGRARIASKYLAYAATASVAGAVVGIALLSQVLPAVIMEAYAIIYFVPQMAFPLPIDVGLAALSAGLGVGITLVATWGAVAATLREGPAALMLPRAPKAGRRILLERMGWLWKRLSFTWKVTMRNLFRYKKRLVMTVIGIAGCTALLLTGLGLSDSINDIIDKQFGDIERYNATVTMADDASDEDAAQAEAMLNDGANASAWAYVQKENLLVRDSDGADVRIEAVTPEDTSTFGELIDLRTRIGQEQVPLADDGLVLTEKIATKLGVQVGDTVTFYEQDAVGNPTGVEYAATLTGIVENYVYHYAYIGPELWRQMTGDAPEYTTLLAVATSDEGQREQLAENLRAIDGVKTVAYSDETIDTYRSMLRSVNMVVVVLVVAAAALAFIVLYNLTNINITERVREIATLKVLGFTPREVNAYIFRETLLLALIGSLVGLLLGIWMESFVVGTAEVDAVMFGREIHPVSFALALALTMVFAAVVMVAMRGKLARVGMVESLKSNE